MTECTITKNTIKYLGIHFTGQNDNLYKDNYQKFGQTLLKIYKDDSA